MLCLWLSYVRSALKFLFGNLKETKDSIHVGSIHWGPSECKRKKKRFKSLPLCLLATTQLITVKSLWPTSHTQIIWFGCVMIQIVHDTALYNQSEISATEKSPRNPKNYNHLMETTKSHLFDRRTQEIWGWFLKRAKWLKVIHKL